MDARADRCARFNVIRLPEGNDCWIDDEAVFNPSTNRDLTAVVAKHQHTPLLGAAGLFLGVNDATWEAASLTLDQEVTVITWWRTVTAQGNNPEALRERMAHL